MRRSNVQNLGQVVSEFLKEFKIDHKLKEVGIVNAWGDVLGSNISRVTSRIFVKNRVLFVHLSSPVVRNELMMMKSNIIKALNENVGASVIDEIVMR